jgi:hypothetical protein
MLAKTPGIIYVFFSVVHSILLVFAHVTDILIDQMMTT